MRREISFGRMTQNGGVHRHQKPMWLGQSQRGGAVCYRYFTVSGDRTLGLWPQEPGWGRGGALLEFTPLMKLKSILAQPEMWRDLDKKSGPYLDGSVFSA